MIEWYKEIRGDDCKGESLDNGLFMYGRQNLSNKQFCILDGYEIDPRFFTSLSIDNEDPDKFVITKYWDSSSINLGSYGFNERIGKHFPYLSSIERKDDELELKFNFKYGNIEFPYTVTVKANKGQVILNYISTISMYTFFDKDNNQTKWIQFCYGEPNVITDFPYLIVINKLKGDEYEAIKFSKDQSVEKVWFQSLSLLNGHFIPIKYKNNYLEVSYSLDLMSGYLNYSEIVFNDKYVEPYEHVHIAYTPIYINNRNFYIDHESGITIFDSSSYYCMDSVKICSPEQLR